LPKVVEESIWYKTIGYFFQWNDSSLS
jgi:hypothetical protein